MLVVPFSVAAAIDGLEHEIFPRFVCVVFTVVSFRAS